MKPDWKDAPEWARWLALDSSGQWLWFARKPRATRYGTWRPQPNSGFSQAVGTAPKLERRP